MLLSAKRLRPVARVAGCRTGAAIRWARSKLGLFQSVERDGARRGTDRPEPVIGIPSPVKVFIAGYYDENPCETRSAFL